MTSFLSLGIRRKKTPAQLVKSSLETLQIISNDQESSTSSPSDGGDGNVKDRSNKSYPPSSSIVGLNFLEKATKPPQDKCSAEREKEKVCNNSSSSSSGSISNDGGNEQQLDGATGDIDSSSVNSIQYAPTTTTITPHETIELSEPEKKLCSRLHEMKVILYGETDKEVDEEKANELSKCIQSERLMVSLIEKFLIIPFEARKDIAQIFNNLVRKNILNFVGYLDDNLSVVDSLIEGYHHPDVALNSGSMLRECIRHDSLARAIFKSNKLWLFFDKFLHLPNFDVASDAFNSLRDLLTTQKNKSISAEFLESKFDEIFSKYESLLLSENYVTKRRSLKLLSGILLERINFNVMIRYISSKDNLKLIMNQLRDQSSNIQFEAFHVFKIFVAYPNKPADISNILYRNRVKLIAYLESFHLDSEDMQFHDEKRLLIETLHALEEVGITSKPSEIESDNSGSSSSTSSSTSRNNKNNDVNDGMSDLDITGSDEKRNI